jgi:hypothetical protein
MGRITTSPLTRAGGSTATDTAKPVDSGRGRATTADSFRKLTAPTDADRQRALTLQGGGVRETAGSTTTDVGWSGKNPLTGGLDELMTTKGLVCHHKISTH